MQFSLISVTYNNIILAILWKKAIASDCNNELCEKHNSKKHMKQYDFQLILWLSKK